MTAGLWIRLKRKNKYFLVKQWISDIFFWCVGGLLYAAAINIFTAPNNILLGGFSGIATVLNYLFGLPIGTVIFVLNVPFFIIAFYKFGRGFIVKTAVATFISSLFIDLSAQLFPVYSGDRLLSSIYGGVLAGAGLGIIFLRGATTGGTDIIAKLLRLKFPHLSMGRVILYLDIVVIALSFFVYRSVENMLLALIVIFVSSQAIDYTVTGNSHSKMIFIVTQRGGEVKSKITSELNRGVTVINAEGGYTGEQKTMLFCAVRANDVARVSRAIKAADEGSFIVVSDADEILGEGFRRIDV